MDIHTGYFDNPEIHHEGWFKVYRGKGVLEVWAGHNYVTIFWGK